MKARIAILALIFCLFAMPGLIFGADFGSNSATLTNPYLTFNAGSRVIYYGYDTSCVYQGQILYLDAVATEMVDTVNCLKTNWIFTSSGLTTLWMAQDTGGNVKMLKMYDVNTGTSLYFGKDNAILVVPATPATGQVILDFRPFGINQYTEIVEIGVTLPQLCTGFGPFTNCLKEETRGNALFYYTEYDAPGGMVKRCDGNTSVCWEIKEVVGPGRCDCDLNSDHRCDMQDWLLFGQDWGRTGCP